MPFRAFLFVLCLLLSSLAQAETTLTVLGSGGPELDDGRASSGYLVSFDGHQVLVDCGPGVSVNFHKAGGKLSALKTILISHLHVDHSNDLAAFVKGAFFSNLSKEIQVYGPGGNELLPSIEVYLETLFTQVYPYLKPMLRRTSKSEITFRGTSLEGGQYVKLPSGAHLRAVEVGHGPFKTLAYVLVTEDKKMVFASDHSDPKKLADYAVDCDLLVLHNAVDERATGVAHALHARPTELGRLAHACRAKMVLLNHRMKRTIGLEAETERKIRQSYSGRIIWGTELLKIGPSNSPQSLDVHSRVTS